MIIIINYFLFLYFHDEKHICEKGLLVITAAQNTHHYFLFLGNERNMDNEYEYIYIYIYTFQNLVNSDLHK